MKNQCRLIRLLVWLCFFIQLGFFVMAWSSALPDFGVFVMRITPNGMNFDQVHQLAFDQRLLGVALGLPPVLVMSYGLWHLDKMLINFQANAMFALATIRHLRSFAGATILSVFLGILELPMRGLFLGLLQDGKLGRLTLGVQSEELLLLLISGLFYLITRMMHESRRLAEENEAFV